MAAQEEENNDIQCIEVIYQYFYDYYAIKEVK